MGDVAILWDNTLGVADWGWSGGDVATGPDLQSAVLVSLFSDRRAPPDLVLAAGQDRRGHWSDSYEPRPIGSLLWTLDRAVFSGRADLVLLARNYVQDALAWLTEDGIAASVEVQVQRANATTLAIAVTVVEPMTFTRTALNYSYVWGQAP